MRKPGSSGDKTRRHLRSAAIRLLSKHGYEDMNLRMLAKRIGVRVGSLYNYFDSKQGLLFWLMSDTLEVLLLEVEKIKTDSNDPQSQLRDFVAFHLGYHLTQREEATVLSMTEAAHRLSPKNLRAILKLQRQYTDHVYAIILSGVRTGKFKTPDPRLATFALVQMLTTVIRWYKANGRLKPDQLIAVYTELSLTMLGVPMINLGESGAATGKNLPAGEKSKRSCPIDRITAAL